jgi:hypothetical protein
LPSESVPGCLLLDVRIPGLGGPELQARLSGLGSTLPIIFLTGHPDIPTTVRAIKAGANDFLTKPVSSDELFQAIERAIAHHEVTFGLKSNLNMVRARIATLTPREREVFELVIRGDTNKQIARARLCRTHDQGPSPEGDGENACPHLGRACLCCRTSRCLCVGYRGLQSRSRFRRSVGVHGLGGTNPARFEAEKTDLLCRRGLRVFPRNDGEIALACGLFPARRLTSSLPRIAGERSAEHLQHFVPDRIARAASPCRRKRQPVHVGRRERNVANTARGHS